MHRDVITRYYWQQYDDCAMLCRSRYGITRHGEYEYVGMVFEFSGLQYANHASTVCSQVQYALQLQ